MRFMSCLLSIMNHFCYLCLGITYYCVGDWWSDISLCYCHISRPNNHSLDPRVRFTPFYYFFWDKITVIRIQPDCSLSIVAFKIWFHSIWCFRTTLQIDFEHTEFCIGCCQFRFQSQLFISLISSFFLPSNGCFHFNAAMHSISVALSDYHISNLLHLQ